MGRRKQQRGRQRRGANGAVAAARSGMQVWHEKGEDGVGFLYSYNHGNGRPEYYVPNVPADKGPLVREYLFYVASLDVEKHSSILGPRGALFWPILVEDESKKSLLYEECKYLNQFSKDVPIYEFRPVHECSIEDDWWGRRPPAPEHEEEMVDDILAVWVKQRYFYIECTAPISTLGDDFMKSLSAKYQDVRGHQLVNLPPKRIDLTVALKHTDDWKVDWDKNLKEEQVKFVKENAKYFRNLTRALWRPNPVCENCGALEGLRLCTGCKRVNYCSKECQKVDWEKSHKTACKEFKYERNNEFKGKITVQKSQLLYSE